MDACSPARTERGLSIRLIPHAAADGPYNMALDEALLSTAVAGAASLRFYCWSQPTLSLGYFQPHAPALQAVPGIPWVRRATGGAALVHHHELTYALAVPPGRAWQPLGQSWICAFHHAVRLALVELGIEAHLATQEHKASDALCFLHHTPGDLILGSHKVAGSAQKKSHGAMLQHGGILLKRSLHAPQLPGIIDLTGRALTIEGLQGAITSAFLKATGWVGEPSELTPHELREAERLREERYRSEEWNNRR
jgi:lipoate-protein ligase A